MTDHLLKFKPGLSVTFRATTDLIGGQLVEVTGSRTVGVAGAGSAKVVGSASQDAKSGTTLTVHINGPVDELVASAAIAAGDKVVPAANGQIATGTTGAIGLALTAATKAGDKVQVLRG